MRLFFYLSLLFSAVSLRVLALSVTPEMAIAIGDKIWKNECGGSIEGLTSWNKGENFASLGIGHFIWYSEGGAERFRETFPDLLLFMQKQGVKLPKWLQSASFCPWKSREDFYNHLQSAKMKSLRQFLLDTRKWQALFMAQRLEEVFESLLARCSENEKKKIIPLFSRLSAEPSGLYALIDYVNFKGPGILPSETYQGHGWGLLQVLEGMKEESENPLIDFIASAKQVLTQRVQNAPKERHEERWLKGWLNRIDTYQVTAHVGGAQPQT